MTESFPTSPGEMPANGWFSGGGGNRTRAPFPTKNLVDRDGDRCFYCAETFPAYHVDHVCARSRGGSDDLENLVLACGPCNLEKLAHPAWLFASYQAAGLALPRVLRLPCDAPSTTADWLSGAWCDELLTRSAVLANGTRRAE
jgi:hypothetical protein